MNDLIELFREFPGIGPRQARRFAYFLMSKPKGYSDRLIAEIQKIRTGVATCPTCFRIFVGSGICNTCKENRENTLMIVARDIDFETIEKTHTYHGYYFILGGTIPILEKSPEQKVRIKELLERVKEIPFTEIIFSLSITPEGEHTEEYIRSKISNIKMTTLGRGLSTGSELEYVDAETLKNALKNRFT